MNEGLRSLLGYSKGSPWENSPYNLINTPDGSITMRNTKKKLKAFDAKTGKFLSDLIPGKEYKFDTDEVLEVDPNLKNNWLKKYQPGGPTSLIPAMGQQYMSGRTGDITTQTPKRLPPKGVDKDVVKIRTDKKVQQLKEVGYSDKEAKALAQHPKLLESAQDKINDREAKDYRIKMHPDYNPNLSFEEQESLLGDNSLRTRVLRGRNTFMNMGTPLTNTITGLALDPVRGASNMLFDAEKQYFNKDKSWAENLTNFGMDAMSVASPSILSSGVKNTPNKVLNKSTQSITKEPILAENNILFPKKEVVKPIQSNHMDQFWNVPTEKVYSFDTNLIDAIKAKHKGLQEESSDIINHWVFNDPSEITKLKKFKESITPRLEHLNKVESTLKKKHIPASRQAGLNSKQAELKYVEDYISGDISLDLQDNFIKRVISNYKKDPVGYKKYLEESVQKKSEDLVKYGDKFYIGKGTKLRSFPLAENKFTAAIDKKLSQINSEKTQIEGQIQSMKPKFHPEFESKIKKLREMAKENPEYSFENNFDNGFGDNTKTIYPNIKDDVYNSLSEYEQNYINNNLHSILGVNFGDGPSITLGATPDIFPKYTGVFPVKSSKISFNLFKPKTWKPTIKEEISLKPEKIIQEYKINYPTDNNYFNTVSHESGHDMQKIDMWRNTITKNSDKYNYTVSRDDNPIARLLKKRLVTPDDVGGAWKASPLELHSDVVAKRTSIIRDLKKDHNMTTKEAVDFFRKNESVYNEAITNQENISSFFKPHVTSEQKQKILKILPATVPAVGAGTILANQEEKPKKAFQLGGLDIDSTLNANSQLDWVKRLYEKKPQSIQIPGVKGKSTHYMEQADNRVYPTVIRDESGKLKYLGKDAYNYADSTKTFIKFPSDKEALEFAERYKQGTGVLKGFKKGGWLNKFK